MLLRSAFPVPLAAAHVRVWADDIAVKALHAAPARACEVSPGYSAHRAVMVSRYAAFIARFAPTISLTELAAPDRPRLLVAVPIVLPQLRVVSCSEYLRLLGNIHK